MLNFKPIYDRYGNGICRKCINKVYHANLEPEDCHYFIYPHRCPRCGNMRNIVVGFRLRGRAKMLFRR